MSDLASHAVCQRFGANKECNRGHKNPRKRGARIEDREQRRRLLLGATDPPCSPTPAYHANGWFAGSRARTDLDQ
jgi:hypothetical protein